jgi:8-oxo-dGTP diphosphatase
MPHSPAPTILHVVGAAIAQGKTCLVARRGPSMSLAGKWEFPGGKVEANEAPSAALAREIVEELGLVIAVGSLLGTGMATVGTKVVKLDVYEATLVRGTMVLREHSEVRWATADELHDFDWADADIPSVPKVTEWLRHLPE